MAGAALWPIRAKRRSSAARNLRRPHGPWLRRGPSCLPLLSAFLVEEEGTASSFVGLKETVVTHGLSRRSTRSGQPLFPHSEGRRAGRQELPDASRTRAQAARHPAHPELLPGRARRIERLFGTLRSRPTAGLRTSTSRSTTRASRSRLPRTERPSCPMSGRSTTSCASRRSVWSARTTRCATETRALQIPEQRHRHHFVKVSVRVHEYPDSRLAIFHGPNHIPLSIAREDVRLS